ncbi:MAG: hypothetical protein K2Q20_13445, partial [Phycisphaerales bacterium]|nr:hypothetical protein [Phycisphaerales bacterium]
MPRTDEKPPAAPATAPIPGATLRVAEAMVKDVGRGIARIDPEELSRLNLKIGDTVAIVGKRTTVCRVHPTHRESRGQSLVQLDGLTRGNAGVGLDDRVGIAPAAVKPAQQVTLSPAGTKLSERDLKYVGSLMDGLAVVPGDRVRVTLFGSRPADFTVDRAVPAGPVLIHAETRLIVGTGATAGGRPGAGTAGAEADRGGRVSYEDVGGLKGQVQRIREMIELPLRFPEVFERL